MFTGDMIGADVGSFIIHSQRKVVPSCLMVALRLVDGKLAVFVVLAADLALHIFLDIWMGEQMLETSGEFAIFVHIRCQKGDCSSLHFEFIRNRSECTRALPLFDAESRATYGIVSAAH